MSRHVELFTNVLFRSRSQRPFRTLVIGNCQSRYLAGLFEIALADCACDYLVVHEITTDHQRAAIDAYLDEHRNIYRLILTISLGSAWHAIGRDALVSRFGADRLFFLLNLYFSGTHPDQTGLGELNARIISPMGGLHSKIALGGWMAGLPTPEITKLFAVENMETFGFLRMFEESTRELRHRETVCDTNFTDQMVEAARMGFSFYTYNHPTPNIFAYFVGHVRQLLLTRGQARSSGIPMNAMLSTETLALHGVWPVYPELKELLSPHFPVSTYFILPEGGSGEVISREVFVQRSIATYEKAGREKIAPLRQAIDAKAMIDRVRV